MSRKDAKSALEAEVLGDLVQSLADEVKVLRNAVDELREELQWANHNVFGGNRLLENRRVHSFSLDPPRLDFAVNTVEQGTVDELRSELASTKNPSTQQRELSS